MASYQRPPFESRSPRNPDQKRPQWDPVQRLTYQSGPSPTTSKFPDNSNALDPESDDSDVSRSATDPSSTFAVPITLPTPPPKHASENSDAVQHYLSELERVEDHNIKKQTRLREKRARKDDKIRRRRELQDAKIKAIMDARARRDERVGRRRQHEDATFQRFFDDLEDEEGRMRIRLKRLKRGLPIDDSSSNPQNPSMTPMSPPGPPYSSVPPPAKRHKSSLVGPPETPSSNTPRPFHPTNPTSGPPPPPPPPSYQFYPQHQAQYTPQYHHPTNYTQPPPNNSSISRPTQQPYPPPSVQPPPESSPYPSNGHPGSPHASRPKINLQTAPSQPATPSSVPLGRQPSTSYDTRPPPTSSSGFASINAVQQTGFASINAPSTATPPPQKATPVKESTPSSMARPTEYNHTGQTSHSYGKEGTPIAASSLTPSGGSASKRTPSTTHPYQMSEAFANRHHHCERVDSLNRGIWTWYGNGGTQELPTLTPTEMYLKCNHDDCGRIDWRTVHGLQCHIVKNHEQPKGTIGSLEKALERYGVPIVEIETYEREHGLGSGGTMADPKNMKIKAKTRDSSEAKEIIRKGTPSSAGPTPHNYRANLGVSLGSPAPPDSITKSVGTTPRPPPSAMEEDRVIDRRPVSKAPMGFAAVNAAWQGINTIPAKVQGSKDVEMKDVVAPVVVSVAEGIKHTPTVAATPAPVESVSNPPAKDPAFWPSWQGIGDQTKQTTSDTPATDRTPASVLKAEPEQTTALLKPSQAVNTKPTSQESTSVDDRSITDTPAAKSTPARSEPPSTIIVETPQKPVETAANDEPFSKDKISNQSAPVDAQRNTPPSHITVKVVDIYPDEDNLPGKALKKEPEVNEPAAKEPEVPPAEAPKSTMQSPQLPNKPPPISNAKRASRRSSMVAPSDKPTEPENEDTSPKQATNDSNSTTEIVNNNADGTSATDETIVVIVSGNSSVNNDRDVNKTPNRRMANGRFRTRRGNASQT